jgi:hypothetical protein
LHHKQMSPSKLLCCLLEKFNVCTTQAAVIYGTISDNGNVTSLAVVPQTCPSLQLKERKSTGRLTDCLLESRLLQ